MGNAAQIVVGWEEWTSHSRERNWNVWKYIDVWVLKLRYVLAERKKWKKVLQMRVEYWASTAKCFKYLEGWNISMEEKLWFYSSLITSKKHVFSIYFDADSISEDHFFSPPPLVFSYRGEILKIGEKHNSLQQWGTRGQPGFLGGREGI